MMDWIFLLSVIPGTALGTLGFSVLFNAPPRALPFAVLVGVTGQIVNQALRLAGYPDELAAFAGGLAVGLMADIGARLIRTPATVFTVSGFIPLVPGVLAFQSVKEIFDDRILEGIVLGVRTMLIGGAIAAGLSMAAAVRQFRRRSR